MWNERFCQNTLLRNNGSENFAHPEVPGGQVTEVPSVAVMFGVFCIDTSPAGSGTDCSTWLWMQSGSMVGSQPGGGVLASGAPSVLKSTPAEAVESLDMTVLLMNFTFSASTSDTPPPSQPATL